MGTARFETVMDYAARGVDVAVRCRSCGRTRNMSVAVLGEVFGLSCRVAEVQRRFRCRGCGERGAKLAPIPKLE